jgi:excinuclease ABC subunit C
MTKSLPIQVKQLPRLPGVYLLKDKQGKILYVGKAKNLRNRARSYFALTADLTPSKRSMVGLIEQIGFTVTDNEHEALLLETNLIKQQQPPYNVILKDDKYWQYIKLDKSTKWWRITAVRRLSREKAKADFFGPYTSGMTVKETLRLIKKIFPVCLGVQQSDGSDRKVVGARACFNYHLGRCPGACVGIVTAAEYNRVFADVKKFIKGAQQELLGKLRDKMSAAASWRHFEAAARIRDQIKALDKLRFKQKVVLINSENIDLLSLYRESEQACINVFRVRQGKLMDKFNSVLSMPAADEMEALESFAEQYYAKVTEPPDHIVVAMPLSIGRIGQIPVKTVYRGKKAQLVKLGETNAREFLHQQETFFSRQHKRTESALVELQRTLRLKFKPQRIEAYDISNIQGKFATGAMVVFVAGEPIKPDYRKFRIKIEGEPNDLAMLGEMIKRRLKHIDEWPSPDLIVVDGGRGQLNATLRIIKTLKHESIRIIALAKRKEEIYLPGKSRPLRLSKSSQALHLLQRMRDEAHRFALGYYRQRHSRASLSSVLDTISGIGPKTKKTLKAKYSSIDKIGKAPKDELTELIGPVKAAAIRDII